MQYLRPMNLYTVGYEGVALEQFVERLRLADVQVVVDVRDVPLSRKRGFSKTALSAALSKAGVQYLHIRELGCPKPIRDQYRLDGDWKQYTVAFMAHLRQQAAAVRDLAEVCGRSTVALLSAMRKIQADVIAPTWQEPSPALSLARASYTLPPMASLQIERLLQLLRRVDHADDQS